jgi:hypothetical protein
MPTEGVKGVVSRTLMPWRAKDKSRSIAHDFPCFEIHEVFPVNAELCIAQMPRMAMATVVDRPTSPLQCHSYVPSCFYALTPARQGVITLEALGAKIRNTLLNDVHNLSSSEWVHLLYKGTEGS